MTINPPADAAKLAEHLHVLGTDQRFDVQGIARMAMLEAADLLAAQASQIEALTADKARLDWLDQVNAGTNERNGTRYGWRYDINHNRAALTDHNYPPLSVREAIDAARAVLDQEARP